MIVWSYSNMKEKYFFLDFDSWLTLSLTYIPHPTCWPHPQLLCLPFWLSFIPYASSIKIQSLNIVYLFTTKDNKFLVMVSIEHSFLGKMLYKVTLIFHKWIISFYLYRQGEGGRGEKLNFSKCVIRLCGYSLLPWTAPVT